MNVLAMKVASNYTTKSKKLIADKNGVHLISVPTPIPLPGQVQIRAVCSLVSAGTELYYIRKCINSGQDMGLGYCSSGYVERIGKGVKSFGVGDRVIAMGWGYAQHAEIICVPYRLCFKIPDELPFEEAVFANLAATAMHAVHRGALTFSDRVLVVGAGLVGQLVAQHAALYADSVCIADFLSGRLAVAESTKINVLKIQKGQPLDIALLGQTNQSKITKIFLCIASVDATEIFNECVTLLSKLGNGTARSAIICAGRFHANLDFSVDMGNIDIRYSARCGEGYHNSDYVHGMVDCVTVQGESTVDKNLFDCLKLIADGQVKVKTMHTHKISFNEAPAAYELFSNPDSVMGVTFHY